MRFQLTSNNHLDSNTELLVLGVYSDKSLTPSGEAANKFCQNKIHDVIQRGDIIPEVGKSLLLTDIEGISNHFILLIGLGKKKHNISFFRKLIKFTYAIINQLSVKSLSLTLHEVSVKDFDEKQLLNLSVLEWMNCSYTFNRHKAKAKSPQINEIALTCSDPSNAKLLKSVHDYHIIAKASFLTRDLGNEAPNICTPNYMLEQAKLLAEKFKNISVDSIDDKQAEKLGMGAFCSVSQGSAESGQMIFIHFNNNAEQKPVALIGKGISFDTGGNILKARDVMKWMKFDMCGAASVLGTMQACAEMDLPINLIGVMTCAENMIGDKASRPGDVITTLAGHTVEVVNTDAEGRLVLCDAITYTQQQYQPRIIIDVATLTGAVIAAFASNHTAVMSNNNDLAKQIIDTGNEMEDPCWRMPYGGEYECILDSPVADMLNGRLTGEASSVVAATYLSRFIENDIPWVHLDIAGSSIIPGKDMMASGRPIPLLCKLIMDLSGEHGTD